MGNKQFTVGVLNAVLGVSALAGMLCPRASLQKLSMIHGNLAFQQCSSALTRVAHIRFVRSNDGH